MTTEEERFLIRIQEWIDDSKAHGCTCSAKFRVVGKEIVMEHVSTCGRVML